MTKHMYSQGTHGKQKRGRVGLSTKMTSKIKKQSKLSMGKLLSLEAVQK